MGKVSKRQQPNQNKKKHISRRSPTSLQCSKKFPHPQASFSYIYFYNISKHQLNTVKLACTWLVYKWFSAKIRNHTIEI